MLFNVTFETITEESAEHGEFEDIGFTMQDVSLREAYDFLRFNAGHCEASCSDIRQARWLTFTMRLIYILARPQTTGCISRI